jgi:uncharacterized sporulation protein YeaH/YhbH (DUF444 family)
MATGTPHFIDRRLNPKQKSLGNRQRFMRRARAQIKEVVNNSIKDRNVSDVANGETISIPTKGIGEPRLHHAPTGGRRDRVFTGNKEFHAGDRIPKPAQGGQGEGGKKATDRGEGEDEFQFVLSREEFLDLFFEDLELPDLVKTSLKEVYTYKPHRAGFATSGSPSNINVLKTMRNSFGRRIALKRPTSGEEGDLTSKILELEARSDLTPHERQWMAELHKQLEELKCRRKAIPYVDPFDIRYNRFDMRPEPNTNAVMFCLMDVSGSMGEREKDLAKRFFILLHMFLKRRYERIEVVFVRHTHEAQEVDEETFFYSRETGGTVVSTALREMLGILRERYPPGEWNIYAAQASDGDNFSGDAEKCIALLDSEVMPLCQYYAYVEILDEREMELFQDPDKGTALWQAYRAVSTSWPNFEMKRIAGPGDIYPVFRDLFAKQAADG